MSGSEPVDRVLSLNAGSSSLKFGLFETHGEDLRAVASGVVERVGQPVSVVRCTSSGGASLDEDTEIQDHGAAVAVVLDWLEEQGFLGGALRVGHRVVHGGTHFTSATRLDDDAIDRIDALSELAPLHNPSAVAVIRAARKILGPGTEMFAVFDTAFFAHLPDKARTYAIPRDLARRHGIVRYGFHGLAHQWMSARAAALLDRPPSDVSVVTLQLGAGCSAAAVSRGRAIDTSMGMTPLEGLVMATRSGSVDPSIVDFIARKEGIDAGSVVQVLNKQSGLAGLSGHSPDMRDLLERSARGDERAGLAVDVFAYQVTKHIGAYAAALGEIDAIVFGGGIGENAAPVREKICSSLGVLGVAIDDAANAAAAGVEADIATRASAVRVLVVPVDEMTVIARSITEMAEPGSG